MTPGGEVLLTILAAMAEQESRTMSANIKWRYQKKFQNGEVILNTGMVLGYKKSSAGEYVIAEDGRRCRNGIQCNEYCEMYYFSLLQGEMPG